MSDLLELQTKIQDTHAAIARAERMLAEKPDLPSLTANMRSLQKRYEQLRADFAAAADQLGIDVCSYRVFTDGQRPTLSGLANALGDFQSLFSVVYDAIRSGPKIRARISPDVVRESSFLFAYTFPGSLGFALTLPNDRLLLEEVDTVFDQTMKSIFGMAKSEAPDAILAYAKRLGPASVRALYRWANDNARAGFGAAIEWRRKEAIRADVLVQKPELERLAQAIDMTSDSEITEMEFIGDLVGADVQSQTFHMKSGETEIKGRFADAISPEHAVMLPKPYRARIRKTTKIYYSTEREEESFFLLRLEPE